jgi:multiple sugar transport system substrate-binding protein
MKNKRRISAAAVLAAAALALTACASGSASGSGSNTDDKGVTTLELWTHNGGNRVELDLNKKVVNDFNASQAKFKVDIKSFPQAAYNDAVTAAASAKKLPCVMDIDSPNVPNWAWAGYLEPLSLDQSLFANQLPSTLGKVNDKLYSFGYYDVALNLVARKSVLQKAGMRIPTVDKPWTVDEFNAGIAKIKDSGAYKYPLDMGTAGTGEWIPYAYSPILASFGGDLINRDTYTTAEGKLTGPEAIAYAQWFQKIIKDGYAAKKSGADSTADFVNGKTAVMWSGSWAADAVSKKFGKDVVFLPPVDFGHGAKIGGGSWQWGVSSNCAAKDGAMEYMKFSAQAKYFVDYPKTLSLIPVTPDAAAKIPAYAPGGKYRVFFDLASKFALVRPVTPAYPFISTTFAKANSDILSGGDPKTILDKAAKDIDNNVKSNGNYQY